MSYRDDRDYYNYRREREEEENEEMLQFFILGGLGLAIAIAVLSAILYFIAGWLDQTFGTALVPLLNEHLPEFLRRPTE